MKESTKSMIYPGWKCSENINFCLIVHLLFTLWMKQKWNSFYTLDVCLGRTMESDKCKRDSFFFHPNCASKMNDEGPDRRLTLDKRVESAVKNILFDQIRPSFFSDFHLGWSKNGTRLTFVTIEDSSKMNNKSNKCNSSFIFLI